MPEQSFNPHQRAVVFAVATFNTKAEELAWVAACLRQAMVKVVTVDVSAATAVDAADVKVAEILAASGLTLSDVQSRDHGALQNGTHQRRGDNPIYYRESLILAGTHAEIRQIGRIR